jgi:hypothetical protein
MFKPQFAPLVESGAKLQTVRPIPNRMPKAGDRISLRMWTGKPYRSKQRVLREAAIVAVETFSLCDTGRELLVYVNGYELHPEQINAFAVADGFKNGINVVVCHVIVVIARQKDDRRVARVNKRSRAQITQLHVAAVAWRHQRRRGRLARALQRMEE